MLYDVIIVGGGPGGLSAALALGRARKRVLVCDAGPRRNAAVQHLHNFVTRDGTPPEAFRQVGREQLAAYPHVELREVRVEAITGRRGAFRAVLGGEPGAARDAAETIAARRVLLCTGMIDEMLPIPGFRELWGHAIYQRPYCHGWEVRDRRWGYLVLPETASHLAPFALQARGWTREVTVFTHGAVEVTTETRTALETAGIRLETAPIARLVGDAGRLEAIELASGARVPCAALFAHPPQRQVELVRALGVGLDDAGYVVVEPMRRETSVAGIYAAGDLTTRGQGAVLAAAAGTMAAAAINVELTMELALARAL